LFKIESKIFLVQFGPYFVMVNDFQFSKAFDGNRNFITISVIGLRR